MIIVEAVIDHLAFAATADQAQCPEDPQMLRHGRLREADDGREVTNAQLLLEKRIDDLGAAGIAKRTEKLGKLAVNLIGEKERPPASDLLRMDAAGLAPVNLG